MLGHVTGPRRGGAAGSSLATPLLLPLPLPIILSPLLLLLLLSLTTGARAYEELSDDALRGIPTGGAADFDPTTRRLLAPLLIPRVPGTAGSAAAQRHLAGFFERELHSGWQVTWQNSTSRVPATATAEGEEVVAEVPFANLVLRRDPPWAREGDVARLTLAAHYDSLRLPEGFVGAIDSAAPCALLMHVARAVDDALTRKWADLAASGMAGLGLEDERGLQILFLDGEEAWDSWTETDSLYGARFVVFPTQEMRWIFIFPCTTTNLVRMTDHSRRRGKRKLTRHRRRTGHRWTRLSSSCCWTCWEGRTQRYRRTSRQRTGRTREWRERSNDCGRWGSCGRKQHGRSCRRRARRRRGLRAGVTCWMTTCRS